MAPFKDFAASNPAAGPACGPGVGPGYWYGGAWVVWVLLVLVLAFAFSPNGYWW